MSRRTLTILHAVAGSVHLVTAGVILGAIVNDAGLDWPLINRGWINDGVEYEYKLAYLLPIFPLLSSINHVVSIADRSLYTNILSKKVNVLRWSEYSVSAGVMLWIIGNLSGILEIRSLVTLAILNALLQYFGYLIEEAVARNAPRKEIKELLFAAWGVHMAIWVQIFISFFTVIQENEVPAPSAVYSIIIILFILFSSFGLLTTLWAFKIITNFNLLEMGFIILSLTAKVFLSFMTYFGVLRSDRFKPTETPTS
jgi:hypothetical protein